MHRILALAILWLLVLGCSGAGSREQVEGLPTWLPVYSGSEIQPLYQTPTEEGSQGAVSFVVPASAGDVVKFYRDRFEQAGFEVKVLPFRSQVGRGARLEGGDSKIGFHALIEEENGDTATAVFNYTQAR